MMQMFMATLRSGTMTIAIIPIMILQKNGWLGHAPSLSLYRMAKLGLSINSLTYTIVFLR